MGARELGAAAVKCADALSGKFLALVAPAIPKAGDLAEFGVFNGASLLRLHAALPGRVIHAFDSFCGMDVPGPKDSPSYPRGRFDVGGPDEFMRHVRSVSPGLLILHVGFIPESLEGVGPLDLAFAHLDLDHYAPTLAAARWAWDRLVPLGVMAFHDYFTPEHGGASTAAFEFLESVEHVPVAAFEGSFAVRKVPT